MIDWSSGTSHHTARSIVYPSPLCHPLPYLDIDAEPYHEYLDVFSKKGADTLPPHRAYDCLIELLSGAAIPFGRIFPLSQKELGALKEGFHPPFYLTYRGGNILRREKGHLSQAMDRFPQTK